MSVPHVVPGVYIRLKSITTPLKVKLKLVKYSWLSTYVIIPNKTEVLLDFIVGLLLNKKRKCLSDEDIEAIWQCLEWLLLTTKMQQRLSQKQFLSLKPSFSSVLISSLTELFENKVNYSHSVMTCCKLLLSSSALSYLFISNIENMTNLLSTICKKSLQQLSTSGQMEPHIFDMLSNLIKYYCDSQRVCCHQMHVLKLFYKKLFQSVLILQYKCRHHSDYNSISLLLDELIKNTIFNREQQLLFRELEKLNDVSSNVLETKSRFTQFFTIMKRAITGTENVELAGDFKAAVLDYLPKLFAFFIEGETESSAAIQKMLDNISWLLGFNLKECKFQGSVEESKAIEVMGQLLSHINNMNIDNLDVKDNEEKFWFMYSQQLPQILITAERKTESWFLCMKSLILLNPDIANEYLDDILSVCWSVLSEREEFSIVDQVDCFLESILELYNKLRQIPFVFDKLITSVIRSSVRYNFKWPHRFSVRFQNVVQLLPHTVAIQIWEKLLTAIERELAPIFQEDDGDDSISNQKHACSCIIGVLLNFLGHIVVVGPSMTANNTQAIQNLQTRMKVSIMVPSIYLCLNKPKCDPDLLEATLLITYKWWEIILLLAYYTPLGEEETMLDLSSLNFLSASIRKKILMSEGNGALICFLLQLQYIKAIQIFPQCESEKKKAKICDLSGIVNMLMTEDIGKVSVENKNQVLHPDFPVGSINQATWWFLTNNLPILQPIFTPQDILVISQFIVRTLIANTAGHSQREMSIEAGFTRNLIESTFFQEMASFHSAIISCIFSMLADSMLRKDSSEDIKKVAQLFSTLANSELQWNNSNNQEMSKELKIVGEVLCSLFETPIPESDARKEFFQKFSAIIEILKLLPLRFLPPNDKVRLILGLYPVVSCSDVSDCQPSVNNSHLVSSTSPNDQKLSLVTNCIHCLNTMLTSSDNMSTYNYLTPDIVLNFLETSISKIQEQNSNNEPTLLLSYYRLLASSVSSMFQQFTHCPILETYIKKLLKYLQKAKDRICKHSHSMECIQRKYSLKFLFASKFVEELGKMLQQKGLGEEIHAAATKYLKMFSDVILEMVASIDSKIEVCVLALYTSLLGSQNNLPDGRKILGNFPNLVTCCLKNIDIKENFSSLLLSLHFFNFSLNQTHIVSSPEECYILWNWLKDLCSFLLTSSAVSHNSQLSSASENPHINSFNTAVAFALLSNSSDLGLQFDGATSPCTAPPPPPSALAVTSGGQLQLTDHSKHYIQYLYTAIKSDIVSVIKAMSGEQRQTQLHNLILSLCIKVDDMDDFVEIRSATEVLQILVENNVFDNSSLLQRTILNIQLIFQQLQCHCNIKKVTKVIVPLLQLEVKILNCKKNIASQAALNVLFGCQFVPLSKLDVATFELVFHAVYDLLNVLITDYTDIILDSLPSFFGIVKRLIISVVAEGSQNKLSNNKSAEKSICNCAYLVSRLINSMSTHKSALSNVVNYLIAEFIEAYSNVTLLPAVKTILNSSLYYLLMFCNNHMIDNLNATLPNSRKHIFQSIYTIYSKNYKYKGYI